MSLRPADSWYEATARRDAPLPSLEGDIDADVCVVGAGLSGCSTAMHLAERGYKVVVLEADRIGFGASGRSGGQIIPGWAGGMDKIAAQLGKADAKRVWDFSLEGVEMTRALIERNQIDCDLAWGHMHVALKPRQRQELLDMQREQEGDFGYRKLRFMERAETESWIASKRYIAGLHDAGAGPSASAALHDRRRQGCDRRRRADLRTQRSHGHPVRTGGHGEDRERERAREIPRPVRKRRPRGPLRTAGAQAHRRRLLYRRDQAARRGARERAPARQHRGRRSQLDHRLLPPFGRPPPAIRRARQLFRA
jgi:hypothetical protein